MPVPFPQIEGTLTTKPASTSVFDRLVGILSDQEAIQELTARNPSDLKVLERRALQKLAEYFHMTASTSPYEDQTSNEQNAPSSITAHDATFKPLRETDTELTQSNSSRPFQETMLGPRRPRRRQKNRTGLREGPWHTSTAGAVEYGTTANRAFGGLSAPVQGERSVPLRDVQYGMTRKRPPGQDSKIVDVGGLEQNKGGKAEPIPRLRRLLPKPVFDPLQLGSSSTSTPIRQEHTVTRERYESKPVIDFDRDEAARTLTSHRGSRKQRQIKPQQQSATADGLHQIRNPWARLLRVKDLTLDPQIQYYLDTAGPDAQTFLEHPMVTIQCRLCQFTGETVNDAFVARYRYTTGLVKVEGTPDYARWLLMTMMFFDVVELIDAGASERNTSSMAHKILNFFGPALTSVDVGEQEAVANLNDWCCSGKRLASLCGDLSPGSPFFLNALLTPNFLLKKYSSRGEFYDPAISHLNSLRLKEMETISEADELGTQVRRALIEPFRQFFAQRQPQALQLSSPLHHQVGAAGQPQSEAAVQRRRFAPQPGQFCTSSTIEPQP